MIQIIYSLKAKTNNETWGHIYKCVSFCTNTIMNSSVVIHAQILGRNKISVNHSTVIPNTYTVRRKLLHDHTDSVNSYWCAAVMSDK